MCFLAASAAINGQRSYPVDAANRLFSEAQDLLEQKNYAGCTDKLGEYLKVAKDRDLLQEAEYLLAYIACLEGKENATEMLESFAEKYPDSRHNDEVCLLAGRGWFAREEYTKAVELLSNARISTLTDTQQEELYYLLARSQFENGEPEIARTNFIYVGEYSSKYSLPSLYYISYIDYRTGKYTNALAGFNKLNKLPEYRRKSDYYIAQIYYMQENYSDAARIAERLLRQYPDSENNAELYRVAGTSYYNLGNQDKAIARLRQYVASTDNPSRNEEYLLGVCEYNLANYKEAITALTAAVRVEDEMGQNANLYLGQSYLHTGDKSRARMAFEAASSMSFNRKVRETALYNYALLVHETSFTGFGESVKVFEKFLKDFPESQYADKVNDYLVEVYLTSKNYGAALESINKIRRPNNKILEAKQNILFQLGNQAFMNSTMPAALNYFNQAIEMGNYDSDARASAYFWRGETYYRMGDYNNATADFNTCRNMTSHSSGTHSLLYYNLGYCYFKRQDFQQALVSLRRYVSLETNQEAMSLADAYNRIGDCLYHDRLYNEAETNYSRAASLQPGSADYSIYQSGFMMGLRKDYQGKISQLDRVINDYPQSPYVDDALYERGHTKVLLERNNEAASSFLTLLSEYPNSSFAPKAGIRLGLLYYNDNELQKAVNAYKLVVSQYPGSEEAKVAVQDLRSLYIDLNDVDEYVQYVNSLDGTMKIEVTEQDSLTFIAAEKLFTRGDFDGAKKSLRNYINTYPSGAFSSNANYYLAKIAFDNKNYPEAKRLFSIVIDGGEVKFREESLARKSEIEYEHDKDYDAALQTFKQLLAVAETRENLEAARLGIMRCAQFTGNEKDALNAADELLKSSTLSPEIETEARYLRAKSYINLDRTDKAIADLTALSKDTRTVFGAEAKYRLAQIYFDNKDVARAEKEMLAFIKEGTDHHYWLARGFILLADIYISKGDDFQARSYLNSLKRNYGGKNEEIDNMYDRRIAKLTK
jgi:TolA-binding protein